MRERPSASMTPTTMPVLRFSSTRCLMMPRISASDASAFPRADAGVAVGCWAHTPWLAAMLPRRARVVSRDTNIEISESVESVAKRRRCLRFDLCEQGQNFLPLRLKRALNGPTVQHDDTPTQESREHGVADRVGPTRESACSGGKQNRSAEERRD